MPCAECEKIREQYPGALCSACAGAIGTLYDAPHEAEAREAKLREAAGRLMLAIIDLESSWWGSSEAEGARARYVKTGSDRKLVEVLAAVDATRAALAASPLPAPPEDKPCESR